MMSANVGGMSLLGVLGVIFIVLKLIGTINWSWWLVLLPFWGGWALFGIIFILALIFYSLQT